MTQKVIQDIRKMGNNHRSKNISMKQNNGSLKKSRKFQIKNKGNRECSTFKGGDCMITAEELQVKQDASQETCYDF